MNKIAWIFPGQGAQAPGMGKAFYDQFKEAKELYNRATRKLGMDIAALCFEGSQEDLTGTDKCQPALFVTALAALTVLRKQSPSIDPVAAAGLSLGELTALAAAGAIDFDDGVYLVYARGLAMAECTAHTKGSMLAVMGLSEEALEAVCQESGAWAANYNTPNQTALSGSVESIEKAKQIATEKGAKRAIKLDVAGAFHSPLMQEAADSFKKTLSSVEIKEPLFPIYSNLNAKFTQNPEEIKDILVQQIISPVRWGKSVQEIIKAGASTFIEFPPARVLTGMLRSIDKSVQSITLNDPEDLKKISDMIPART